MRGLFWLLFVAADITNAYPAVGNLRHERLPRGSDPVFPSSNLTREGSAPASIVTQPHAAGSIATGYPSGLTPEGIASSKSSFHGSTAFTSTGYHSFSPASSSGFNTTVTSDASSGTLPIYPSTARSSIISSAGSGALSRGGTPISHNGSSDFDTGFPGTSSPPTGFSGTVTPATGIPGIGTPATGTLSAVSPATGFPGTGTAPFPIGVPIIAPSSSASSSSTSSKDVASQTLPIIPVSSFSAQSTSIEGVRTNTELTTTDAKGHHTVVPFLFGCWFCGGRGILLWGIGPGPGIYPPPTPAPSSSWPTVTIGNDHIPTVDPAENQPAKNSPTQNEPTETSSTATKTDTSSSSSCTNSTVTDYWVSCASAVSNTTSSCSTYSSSLVTGCSVTATTATAALSCDVDDFDSADSLEEEISDLESSSLEPQLTQTTGQSSYTTAVSGISVIVGPSPGSAPTPRPTNTAQLPSDVLNTGVSKASTAVTSTSAPPLCTPFQDPPTKDRGHCQCSSGSFTTTLPFRTNVGSSPIDPCEYTTLSTPSTTTTPQATISPNVLPFTSTDVSKNVIVCASSSTISLPGNKGATYCAGSSSTVSTGSPIASPKLSPTPVIPSPSANCAFWDEGWGWKFKIYNIGGWSTDGGEKLHHEEKGCGALTGWSWTGGQVSFNLPFLIKNGCVERAIVSAGGPKVACKGKGFGKRALHAKVIRPRVNVDKPSGNPPNFNNATIANAYNPPNVDINAISHTYKPATWDRNRRSSVRRRRTLKKRGCNQSQPGDQPDTPPNIGPPDSIDPLPASPNGPIIPGVDECLEKIREHGKVCDKHAIFYSGFTGGRGGNYARQWAINHFGVDAFHNGDIVDDTKLVDPTWRSEVRNAIQNAFKPDGRTTDGMSPEQVSKLDDRVLPFEQNLSQAYAEMCEQDAYIVVPEGKFLDNQWDTDTTWGGWEYPALTQKHVERIYRVDVDQDRDFVVPDPREFWNRKNGSPQASYAPRGKREASLPDELPPDRVPASWSQNHG